MKVAIVSTHDLEGGAGRAAHRLHQALRAAGQQSMMFVQHRADPDASIDGSRGRLDDAIARMRWRVDHAPAQALGIARGRFAVNWLGVDLRRRLRAFAPDVVHLHWVHTGFVSLGEIAELSPVVWTAHDMWAFTGGCHYDGECARYATDECNGCPMQSRARWIPFARSRLRAKAEAFADADLHIVAPSRWLADVAKASSATAGRSVTVIPNAIDLQRFRPIDRSAARVLYGLPDDATVLLFGALQAGTDARKGFAQLDAALRLLAEGPLRDRLVLCVFGGAQRGDAMTHGIRVRHVGHLVDEESLIALYSAADAFVAPSLQDNLPNTVVEASACGLPTIAFAIGGMPDLVLDGATGRLAVPGSADSLARAIESIATDREACRRAGLAARAHIAGLCASDIVADRHLSLYRDAIAARQFHAARGASRRPAAQEPAALADPASPPSPR